MLYVNAPSYWFDGTGYYKQEKFEGHRREAKKYFREVVRLLREDDLRGVGANGCPLLADFWRGGDASVDRIVENYVTTDSALAGAYGACK